ncbi:MAG: carbohydrate binding family 9 domain-containing protein [Bacteroidales bacterium]|nr:carbohydrate binding family 9 domain-containing protein [Bacteroidales bacterium]
MKKSLYFLIIFFICVNASAQDKNPIKKQINSVKISTAPKIDGVLDDKIWEDIPVATDFIQFDPINGAKPSQKTKVKLAYDNSAIYVGAFMYDSSPKKIARGLSQRDNINNTDWFLIYIDPYNDAITSYGFLLTASGVQVDMKATTEGEDGNWDAVWESSTKINDKGWVAELKIPYSALRIPKKDIQTWGLNMFRYTNRNKEKITWNFIDKKVSGFTNQQGELLGIKNIEPPLRLSFTPYLSSYVEKQPDSDNFSYFIKGGLDLKYGLNESFTLDMMLIPDFGQVQSDDQILNLGPFETYFSEKRAFFTEGTELYEKAEIFYSKRIGSTPEKYYDIELNNNEKITDNPSETQLINSTKITGKTKKGLSVGFLNAMTTNTFATVKDTITGNKRKIKTQPFTNYNLVVLDQSLKNNSYISIINTNMSRFEDNYTANVTGTDFTLKNKKNTYAIIAKGAVSQINTDTSNNDIGAYYDVDFSKISGNFRATYTQRLETDTYNPNDMGFLQNNNEIMNRIILRYNIYNPFWKLLNLYNYFNMSYSTLYSPRKYTRLNLSYNLNTTFKNYMSVGFNMNVSPIERHDYFEARVPNRLFILPSSENTNIWISSDHRKKLSFNTYLGAYKTNSNDNEFGYWVGFSPRFRPNNKLLINWDVDYDFTNNDKGYVDDSNDTIFFGRRNMQTITNTLDLSYIFNNKSSLKFRLRHYWSEVTYDKFYELQEDGYLRNSAYSENNDINYNAFNIDLVYKWNFAPGSELSVVWKNSIYNDGEIIRKNYFDNLNNTISSPQANSFSFKILYYLDYQKMKKKKA